MPKFCLCVFFRSFLIGEKKHINKILPKIPGQSRENFVYVFFFYVFFSLPKARVHAKGVVLCERTCFCLLSMLIRLPLPQCFCPRGRKLRPRSEKNSDQNSDHPRLCIYWGKEKLRPWSEFLGRENSDHGLSFGCFWGRGRRGGSQSRASISAPVQRFKNLSKQAFRKNPSN